jgi:hypothetical protein
VAPKSAPDAYPELAVGQAELDALTLGKGAHFFREQPARP